MNLSKENLPVIRETGLIKPVPALFGLPEKVLQFGTGVLLRGLPDYFIDKANRRGLFNGRVVVVKSTDSGDAGAFDRQDGLYTLCIRGIEDGRKVEENIICSAISRVLSAKDQWKEILELAHRPEMQIIISNTTEVGIQLVEDDIRVQPPKSYPGKLLAFLYERYTALGGSAESGMVVIPTELLVDNGKKLAGITKDLAMMNKLEANFLSWLERHCRFCSSLVDRIVPGKPDAATLQQLAHDLGYMDELLAVAEVYRLWAIEGDEQVKKILSFGAADDGVIIEPDIEIYRELKLRMLNGTHTLSCGLAVLAGFTTVKKGMDDPAFAAFVTDLMMKEIAPAIPYAGARAEAREFGLKVLDRFRNPHLQHQWMSITMQYSSKMKSRVVPVLLEHYKHHSEAPVHIALGFAAFLLFMKEEKKEGWDDKSGYFADLWTRYPVDEVVMKALGDQTLWGVDLLLLKGFPEAVLGQLDILMNKGALTALAMLATKKSIV
ncbi:MAG TPA: tagaturonate reductase [Puia sp.]|jgi:tagaturonate reductase|nr:tagaturonate reductase [Puia sp.]